MNRTSGLSTGANRNGALERPAVHGKIYVVEPDPSSAAFIADLARAHRLEVEQFISGEELWSAIDDDTAGCAVVEVELPGMSGIQLQERISAAGMTLPVIMISADLDAAVAVRAMKLGATDFLQKPCHPLELWEAIQAGLERGRLHRHQTSQRSQIQSRLEKLTAQEQLVLEMLLAGKPNKTIAHALDLSLRSVDFRRASILRKMEARTLVELARMIAMMDRFTPKSGDPIRAVV